MSPPARVAAPTPPGFPRVSGDETPEAATVDLPQCFPRVSGDETVLVAPASTDDLFSPRERG